MNKILPGALLIAWILQWQRLTLMADAGGPANDSFSDATPLGGLEVEVAGRLQGATSEAGEARLTQSPYELPASIWWKWKAPRDGDVLVELFIDSLWPPSFDAVPRLELAIAEGDSLESLRIVNWTSSTHRSGYLGRTCVFRAQNGKTVSIRLAADRIRLEERYRVRVSMPSFPVILEPPRDVPVPFVDAVLRDRGALMTVRAVDGPTGTNAAPSTGALRFQWYKNGQPIEARTNNFLYYATTYPTRRDGLYSVVVTGVSGSTTSAPVRLELVRPDSGRSRLKATQDASGRTVLEMEGMPGQIYQLLRSRDLVHWDSLVDDVACAYGGGLFAMGFSGTRLVLESAVASSGFYRLMEYHAVTDFPINEHLQLIEFKKSELARSLEGTAAIPLPSFGVRENDLFDLSAASWELGGMQPLRIEERYNLNPLGTCATVTLPADIGLGDVARGGVVQLEWPLQGLGTGW